MTKFTLLAILLFIGASVFGQIQTEREVKDLIAHKWKPTHLDEGGQKMPIPAEAREWFLDMKTDGTLIMLDREGEKKGKWSYDHKTRIFTATTDLDPWKFEVVRISETELVMKGPEDGVTMTMYLKRVN